MKSRQGRRKNMLLCTIPTTITLTHRLVCVPVDSLISPSTPFRKFELDLPPCTNTDMSCIYTVVGGKQSLFCFGGICKDSGYQRRHVVEEVYLYDLSKLPETVIISECKDMIRGMCRPLLMQIGDGDCIFVFGETSLPYVMAMMAMTLLFLEYNVKKNEWTDLLGDKRSNFDIVRFDCDNMIRHKHNLLPHVVIGHKLHISLGNSSFAVDTVRCVWEDCKLFETFWLENKGKYGLTPLYSGGFRPLKRATKVPEKKYGGPPLGFYGRAICWDEKILLRVPYAEQGHVDVVTFLLDDYRGRVVNIQPRLVDLGDNYNRREYSSNLVDLGRDANNLKT